MSTKAAPICSALHKHRIHRIQLHLGFGIASLAPLTFRFWPLARPSLSVGRPLPLLPGSWSVLTNGGSLLGQVPGGPHFSDDVGGVAPGSQSYLLSLTSLDRPLLSADGGSPSGGSGSSHSGLCPPPGAGTPRSPLVCRSDPGSSTSSRSVALGLLPRLRIPTAGNFPSSLSSPPQRPPVAKVRWWRCIPRPTPCSSPLPSGPSRSPRAWGLSLLHPPGPSLQRPSLLPSSRRWGLLRPLSLPVMPGAG